MAEIENSKLAVIGAGAVGSSIAFAALIRGSAREVVLYDIDTPKVDAEVLDLAHGTQFTGHSTITGGDDLDLVSGANVVVVTAGAKQHPGQSRLDLAATNVRILRTLMPTLVERAPDAIYVLVTNPCDVLTVAAQRITGLPVGRVFASGTVLDTSRLRWRIAERAGVNVAAVHANIIGEHGDSEFALWSGANIGPVPILDWTFPDGSRFDEAELDQIADDVKNAAYRVIEGKGATNNAIGISGARIVEGILRDEKAIVPVSTVLTDYHGESGIALSVPSIVGSSGVSRVLDLQFNEREAEAFRRSAATVRAACESLGIS